MSCFIVQKSTIDAIVSHIWGGSLRNTEAFGVNNPDALGQTLWDMNHEAYDQRYPYHVDPDFVRPTYTWQYRSVPALQLLKHVQCLRYQCAEGDVPETTPFKRLTDLERQIAAEIINVLPGYTDAPWE